MTRAAALCLALLAMPAHAQEGGSAASLISACAPIAATGGSIRADLTATGWDALPVANADFAIRAVVAAHIWGFAPEATSDDYPGLITQYVPAFRASLNDPVFGQVYTQDGAAAIVLSQGENISCFWAGSVTEDFTAQVATIGALPGDPAAEKRTASRNQTVEAGGRDWTRIESYAILQGAAQSGPYGASARLDRSPMQ